MRALLPILIAVSGVFIVIFVWPAIFVRDDRSPAELQEALRRAQEDSISDYLVPVRMVASPAVLTECPLVSPGSDSPECAAFIEVIADRHAALEDVIARLNDLLRDAPPEMPESVIEVNETLVNLLERVEAADRLLIDAWSNGDQLNWDRGWDLRDSIPQEFADSETP